MKNLVSLFSIGLFLFCLPIDAQKQFTNNGNFKIHTGGSISFFGDFINNGTLVDSGQVINLSGSTAQKIGGSSVTTFKNLTLNNTAGSYFTANENIIGVLTISAGTFSTTGYNFTLISNANGTARIAPILGNFAGNITMQRYLGPGPSSWRFLASPVSGATLNDWQDNFITSGFPGSSYPSFNFVSVYSYDETVPGIADNGYIGASSVSDPIVPGNGYWCYIGPVPLTVDVTGPPVKFSHTFSVSYTPSGGAAEDGYSMIGNPYPSPIDWTSAAWTKNNMNNAIYIWNPALQQYASWVSGVATNGGSNLIASSQSFWVQSNAANPSLSCTEDVKVAADPSFIKPLSATAFAASGSLKLNISGNNYTDETIILFGNGATNGYDSDKDARKLFSSSIAVPGIATRDSTQKDMSVNSMPPVNSVIHIPVKTVVGVAGNYTITNDSSSIMPSGFCIVLEDLVTGIHTNMSSPVSYSFFISDTTVAPRFILHVSESHSTAAISAKCNQYQDGKAIAIAKGTGPWNFTWVNAMNTPLKITANSFLADTLHNLSAGDYSVNITEVNGICSSFVGKITVAEPAPVYAGFIFSADTLYSGENDSLVLQNTSSGAVAYAWNFGDGSTVENSQVPEAHHYSSPGTYTVSQVAINTVCSDTVNHKVVVMPADLSGISKNQTANEIKVYPNPGSGYFFVSLDHLKYPDLKLEVMNAVGQVMYDTHLTSDKTEVILYGQARGIYFYRLWNENGIVLQGKFVNE